jgi:ATP-dependent DNA helicase RecG
MDLVSRVKQMAVSRLPNHPWKEMDDMELFRSAGLYEEDKRTGKRGFNLAGILLFGRDEVIRSCAPGYMTDCLLRRENLDRYDDRLTVTTNLIEAYDQIMKFIAEYTMDRFFLIGDQNVSVRSWIARELVGNTLMHREFSSSLMARVIIEKNRIIVENANRAQMLGKLDPNSFTARSKNPILARFFVNIGRADELGSGVRNLYRYTKMYSGGEPELIEGDIFRTIIPMELSTTEVSDKVGDIEKDRVKGRVNDTQKNIILMMEDNPKITAKELAGKLNINERSVRKNIKSLKESGIVERVGSAKSGDWEVME